MKRFVVFFICAVLTACTAPAPDQVQLSLSISGEGPAQVARLEVPLGAHVSLVVDSDRADLLHIHGYGIETELEPGQSLIEFDAELSGVYEIETHDPALVWAKLVVQ